MDIDNHEDIHCFGRKFIPMDFTSRQFTVSRLLEEYPDKMNVPIYSVGAA